MAPGSSGGSVFFTTDHGCVRRLPDGRLGVSLEDHDWTIPREEVPPLYEAMETLAGRVYRCDCDCRWQLRIDDHETTVLDTDDVLHLHSLLDGAMVMLELHGILDAAAITPPEVSNDDPRPQPEP